MYDRALTFNFKNMFQSWLQTAYANPRNHDIEELLYFHSANSLK